MSEINHGTLRRVFELAIDVPPDQRSAILDRECAAQPELRKSVQAMLDAADDDRFLARPTAQGSAAPAADAPADRSGTLIGPYTLLRLLGEGGFGSVYLAQQSDPIIRKVALKILKPGMGSREVLARFDQERQALAMMDHPNIARVLDAGTTANGQPYVVMDMVEGMPLTQFCDSQNLTVADRLDVFMQVCGAVQHAHTKGIIHRDLKPSNVLVTMQDGRPVARVIDFGIAKAVAGSVSEQALTAHHALIGTPEYMSPEQARGSADLDTRTDVYSLGVLLYELLTGTTPFSSKELRLAGLDEMQRLIRDVDPPNPSSRLSGSTEQLPTVASRRKTQPQRLQAAVKGELDWIVMKALEKDRQRRYDSPSGLSADIARYLSGEPVVAAPPGAAYRVRKFIRRNRVLVTAGTIAVAGLLIGAAGFAWQASVARSERDAAKIDRDRAIAAEAEAQKRASELEKVSEFQAQMIVQVDPTRAGVLLADDVRKRLSQALDKTGLTPQERDRRLATFDQLWQNVNATDAARTLIDSTILAPAVKAIDEQFKDQPAVDASLRHALADVYDTIGMRDAAMPLAVRALETRRRALGDDHPQTLNSMNNLGYLLQVEGKLKEADPLLREVLERKRRVLGEEHMETIIAISNMGTQMYYVGDLEQAEKLYRETLEKARRTLGEGHEITMRSVQTVGAVLRERGKLAEAEDLLRDTLERSRKTLGPDHQNTIKAILHLSSTIRDRGNISESETLLRDASERSFRTLGDSHPITIEARGNLGAILVLQGKNAEAEPIVRESYATSRRALGDDDLSTLIIAIDLVDLLVNQSHFAEAEPIVRDVLERRRRVIGPASAVTQVTVARLARILVESGKFADAEALLALEEPAARAALKGNKAPHLGSFLLSMGRARAGLAQFPAAEKTLLEAHSVTSAARPPGHADTFRASRALADLYAAWNAAAPGNGYDTKAADWAQKAQPGPVAPAEAPHPIIPAK